MHYRCTSAAAAQWNFLRGRQRSSATAYPLCAHTSRGPVLQGGAGVSGVGAMAAGGIGAFAGNMQFGNMASIFGGGCQKVDQIKIPDAQIRWSCGLEVQGKFTCTGK